MIQRLTLPSLTDYDIQQALRYMGYYGVDLSTDFSTVLEKAQARLTQAMHPIAAYRCCRITFCESAILCEGTSLALTGNDIIKHLANCDKVILFCVTLSAMTDTAIRLAQKEDLLLGIAIDSLASAATEQICDLVEKQILSQKKTYATWRFSPGYGDLPLSIQADFLARLDGARSGGVCVIDGGLMTPRKSVTAIIGLSDSPLQKGQRGCNICNMRATCPYHAKGVRCQ